MSMNSVQRQPGSDIANHIRAKVRNDGFGCEVCSTSPPVVKVLGADFGRAREYVVGLVGWLRETTRFTHPVVTVHECDTCGCNGSCPWRTERKADPDAVACEVCDCKWCGCRRCDEHHAHSQLRCELPDGHTLEPHRDVVGNEWAEPPYARPEMTQQSKNDMNNRRWRQEGHALVANVGKDIHAAVVGDRWAVMFRGVVVARGESDKAQAERWLDVLPDVGPALTAMLNVFQLIHDAIGWRERARGAAVAKAIADVPSGCDPLRWANVVKVIAADCAERGASSVWQDAFDFGIAMARPSASEYGRRRFVEGYSVKEVERGFRDLEPWHEAFERRVGAAYEAGR